MEVPQKLRPLIDRLNQLTPFPDTEIARILPLLTPRTIEKGDFFVRAGDVSQAIGFMASGLLRYYYISRDGREIIRYFCQGNSFVSSYTSILTGLPSRYAIQAVERTELIVIKAADWFSLMRSHAAWGIAMQAVQSYALLLAERREAALLTLDAKDRYLQFLEDYPGLEARVRQYDIASYLGITPVALSRIRGTPAPKNREEINLG